MKPSVAILFANLKGNIGDFAILHAMLRDLKQKFPGCSVDIYSHGFHGIDERRLAAFRAADDLDFELTGKTYFSGFGPKLAAQAAKAVGLWPPIQDYLVERLATRVATDAAQFGKYDALFIVGGGNWNGMKVGISMFGTLKAAHSSNDRIYAFPFSVEARITRFNSRRALRQNFRKIQKPLIVRDRISKGVLDKLGVDCVLGADAVFSMRGLAEGIKPAAKGDRSRIILALTGPREKALRNAVERLRAAGNTVALMTTCEIEDGRKTAPVARDLAVQYLAPDSWQEAVAEIKASSLLVTNRLHGLIFGSLAKTPVLPVTNRQKAKAFAEDAALPHNAATLDSVTGLLIEQCLSDRGDILDALERYTEWAENQARSPIVKPIHAG